MMQVLAGFAFDIEIYWRAVLFLRIPDYRYLVSFF